MCLWSELWPFNFCGGGLSSSPLKSKRTPTDITEGWLAAAACSPWTIVLRLGVREPFGKSCLLRTQCYLSAGTGGKRVPRPWGVKGSAQEASGRTWGGQWGRQVGCGCEQHKAHTSLQGPRESQMNWNLGVTCAHALKICLVVTVEKIRGQERGQRGQCGGCCHLK